MVAILRLTTDRPITDFAKERNEMLKACDSEWVLFMDNDEEISPELETEISRISNKYDGYYIKRIDNFMGKWLQFGETGNIKLLRLGKRKAGVWKRKVHEYWDIKNAGELRGKILHYPSLTIPKINQYSEIDANEFGPLKYWELVKPLLKFINNYFCRLGFLDGLPGFIHAYMMSFQSLAVRVKQYEKTINNSNRR